MRFVEGFKPNHSYSFHCYSEQMKTTDMSDSISTATMYVLYPPLDSSETLRKNKMPLALFYSYTNVNSIPNFTINEILHLLYGFLTKLFLYYQKNNDPYWINVNVPLNYLYTHILTSI